MNQKSKSVIVIFAPTACGKTALVQNIFGKSSLSVLKEMGEVVSADSQAVYRGLDIGTAKPTLEERENLPHHLVDFIEPDVQFGVGEFIPLADKACEEIISRGKIPVVAGGTGFYIRNFLYGLPKTPESNPKIRSKLKERIEKEGSKVLYQELFKIDPLYASKINENDSARICRALEVFEITGNPLSRCYVPDALRNQYDFCIIVLNRSRKDLYERINLRVESMFKAGLPDEIEKLKSLGYGKETPAMKAIGYSEFFEGNLSLNAIKEKIKLDSRHYAKKQYTYLKGIPRAHEIDAEDFETAQKIIFDFCKNLRES